MDYNVTLFLAYSISEIALICYENINFSCLSFLLFLCIKNDYKHLRESLFVVFMLFRLLLLALHKYSLLPGALQLIKISWHIGLLSLLN